MKAQTLCFTTLGLFLMACDPDNQQPSEQSVAKVDGFWQGVLPCEDCKGQDWQLRLEDQQYQLVIHQLGEQIISESQIGQFQIEGDRLSLGQDWQFQITQTGLTLLDSQGQLKKSEQNYSLLKRSDAAVQQLQGYYFYYADGHLLFPCDSEQVLPIRGNQQRLELERQFLELGPNERGYFVELFGQYQDKPADEEGWPIQLEVLSNNGLQPNLTCQAPDLEQSWQLTQMADFDLGDAMPDIRFEQGRVTGFSGCNRFFGSYHGRQQQIEMPSLASTRMYCQDNMTIEDQFLKLLKQVDNWQIEEGMLQLLNQQELLMTLQPAANES